MVTGNTTARHGSIWSAELPTSPGAELAVGVAPGELFFTGPEQVRQDVQAMRADMHTTGSRTREDVQAMAGRLHEDMREIRGDVGRLLERVSALEGRPAEIGVSPTAP